MCGGIVTTCEHRVTTGDYCPQYQGPVRADPVPIELEPQSLTPHQIPKIDLAVC